ncbi:MAG: hypothetical protein JOZ69_12880 [Myxococcales bacterium]|nr:hypothetical protein [Myxococcales bacterium]
MAERQKERRSPEGVRADDVPARTAAFDAERRDRSVTRASAAAPSAGRRERDDDVERKLGRAVAFAVPAAAVGGACVAGVLAGAGSALLVLAAGALVGAIGLLWASVRTLSGDAPLASDFESLAARRHGVDALAEQKKQLLRTLKDLESEHQLGKIDDADYEMLDARYRNEAKAVMRRMDVEVSPFREEAERVARDFLKKRGLGGGSDDPGDARREAADGDEAAPPTARTPSAASPRPEGRADRAVCAACSASNEGDAAFCKQCGTTMKRGSDALA